MSMEKNDVEQLFATSSSLSLTERDRHATIHNIPPFLGTNISSSELIMKLTGDVVVAFGVTLGIAPFMSVIDKSIVQRAAGTHTIVESACSSVTSMLQNPKTFVKSPAFLMMWGVYAATYTTANCLKTVLEHQENNVRNEKNQPSHAGVNKFGIFAFTTAVNSATTMMKDQFYAKHFGSKTSSSKVPFISFALWGLRDCLVIGSAFILPEYVCQILKQRTDLEHVTALQISQLTCPVATQVIAGPIQLLGLDFYNRPLADLSYKAATIERIKFQCANFGSIVGARIARIAPAYGIGGVGNTYFREKWRNYLDS
mmetsp:Transcript_1531/g.2192  ORF Transcript_1531/g.2192 Transcript_1531/m.2192 type:complete len:313 (+) Transcript_1531:111-1049(+)